MPKRKKTRHQKIKADSRHKEYTSRIVESTNQEIMAPQSPYQSANTPTQVIATNKYSYLYKDLHKTILYTLGIIIAELFLWYIIFGAH